MGESRSRIAVPEALRDGWWSERVGSLRPERAHCDVISEQLILSKAGLHNSNDGTFSALYEGYLALLAEGRRKDAGFSRVRSDNLWRLTYPLNSVRCTHEQNGCCANELL
jgi:hypothetical protein